MAKILSTVILILTIVLFPPAALAVISNNAVPGDAAYPIKRVLEDAIFAVASLNPTIKAWFAAARSDRRFKEFTSLVAQGKKGEETLNELVEQTQIAASQINQVKDDNQKQKLIQQLSESINKYDLGLQQVSSPIPANPAPVAQETSTPQPTQTPTPVVRSTPRSTITSQPNPAPTTVPTPILPTPHPTPVPTLAPVPHPSDADRQRQIDEARKRLDEIRKRLEEEQRRQREHGLQNESSRQQIRQENRGNDKKDDSKDRSKKDKD
ncbi:hypothetical protein HY357_03810 [Candidatus Roizmanbacteria bacterium]|nr:hypothetical protein [Candidatus Roizmanbacteria bacterium]